ncbi:competence type IV pilus major pilin ComGC [Bacillus sp. 03113]|uniref:competence type IV pilus major pilin ComGC n=1 Tax=Bacillus sp. 03113 TaxID=2578211 RepID=UPI00114452B4|nr:competence type IV pilus major pilin ComGC [Bacillus sp. 03113]
MKNEKGFTLIEMMIVLLIISVLLIITIPNVTKHNARINDKGTEAYLKMVEAQVQAYEMDHNELPENVDDLINDGYLNENQRNAPNGKTIVIESDGDVTVSET